MDIADILYTSLIDAGIRAYRDNEELHTGEEIGLVLLQAIEQSKILIPIFSKGYANSKWCLMELVQMVECINISIYCFILFLVSIYYLFIGIHS